MNAGRAARWARRFMWLYPRRLRDVYGSEIEATLTRLIQIESDRRGVLGRWTVAFGAMADASKERIKRATGSGPGGLRGRLGGGGSGPGDFGHDIRYALRGMVRQPLFFTAAVLTLALGIGANTTVFTVVNGLILRPLPFPDGDGITMVWSENDARGWTRTDVSPGDVWEWRTRSGVFESLGIYGPASYVLTGDDLPQVVTGGVVTPEVLSVLGATPALGRLIGEADARPDAPPVALLSHSLWTSRFGEDATIVGSSVDLDGTPHTVIGVLPPGFTYIEGTPVQVWVALRLDLSTASHGNHGYQAIGRLREGVTLEAAQVEVSNVAAALAEELPDSNEGWSARVSRAEDDLLGAVGGPLSAVLSVGMVLLFLMACTNVANLLLARGNSRGREFAIRAAVGAGRGRVVRQLLTESLVIGGVGGAVGLGLAVLGNRWVIDHLPPFIPGTLDFSLDGSVLVFAFLISLLAVGSFGVIPAVRVSRGIASGVRGSSGTWRGRRAGTTLVIVQMALATVLMVCGGLVARTAVNIQNLALGFDPEGVTTFRVSPPTTRYGDGAAITGFYDRVRGRLAGLPGVTGVGTIMNLPLAGSNTVGSAVWAGEGEDQEFSIRVEYISPGYLETMRTPILSGRDVSESDTEDSPPVVLVNDALIRRNFQGDDPIGAMIDYDGEPARIVGIVADVYERNVSAVPEPAIYVPNRQAIPRTQSVVVRTAGPAPTATRLAEAVAAVDPAQAIYSVQSLSDMVQGRMVSFTLLSGLIGGFALIALLLGSVGIYGVTAYSVSQRTGEIGLRMALGAAAGGVRRLILREGILRAAIGGAIGILGALALTRVLTALLVGVSPTDPATFLGVLLILGSVVVLGSYLPARRASKVDPVHALTGE